ncbi:amino acid racemase [Oceaniradius stylonematis]|uniref:Amino acid racemase n=1 Tax=Oceaniradius stylonematis TaxID=2184161 RepID=A0A3A8ALI2_9HYPH|nr:amino acid racemase [Oceaniradius stylonematis]RKF07514.1 amino acid racemase [Oceaniradius stylonematis]
MTSRKATIGVLGGMGPEATILFMQKMLDAVPANDDCDHVPLIVHNNTQVPSRIRALIEDGGEAPGPVLAAMAKDLEGAGADALAMPCNTAHHYAPVIAEAVSIPFLDMVRLASGKALEQTAPGARIGVLGSPALQATRVFEGPFAQVGLTPIYGNDADARLDIIRSVKKRGVTPDAIGALQVSADRLVERGADVLMVCCTEFSLIADRLRNKAMLFDTLQVLVDACVAFSTGDSQSSEAARGSSAASVPPKSDHLGKENLPC